MKPNPRLPDNYRHTRYAEVGSTMDIVNDIIHNQLSDCHHGRIIQSTIQTNGRGKDSKAWHSPEGGLWFSMVIDMKQLHVREIGLIAALAVMDSVEKFNLAHKPSLEFKMVNDVLLERKKLGGILVERDEGSAFANLGVGINGTNEVRLSPDAPYQPTSLAEHGWGKRDLQIFLLEFLWMFEEHYKLANEDTLYPWKILGALGAEKGMLTVCNACNPDKVIQGAYKGFSTDSLGQEYIILKPQNANISLIPARDAMIKLNDGRWTGSYNHRPSIG